MIQESKEELFLKDYASKHNIYELSSEDIIKLMEKPYLKKEISTAFGIEEKDFDTLKKQKGITNVILENTIRNIEIVLFYIYSKNEFINNKIKDKIVNKLITVFIESVPKKEFYIKNIYKIDFTRENVIKDLLDKKVDINYRLENLSDIIEYIDKMVDILVKQDKKYLENFNNEQTEKQLYKENKLEKNNKKLEKVPNSEYKNFTDDIMININGENKLYHVNFSNEKYKTNKKVSNKKYYGTQHNYKRENETKCLHGKIGEQLALETEKQRLMKLGLEDLIKNVKLVTQIDEETTFDGLGYDLISFNESREPICIEVKTAYGKKDKPFFISKKEIEIIQGLKKEFDCNHCLIYYVLIDGFDVTIKNISSYDLNNMELIPVLYKIK